MGTQDLKRECQLPNTLQPVLGCIFGSPWCGIANGTVSVSQCRKRRNTWLKSKKQIRPRLLGTWFSITCCGLYGSVRQKKTDASEFILRIYVCSHWFTGFGDQLCLKPFCCLEVLSLGTPRWRDFFCECHKMRAISRVCKRGKLSLQNSHAVYRYTIQFYSCVSKVM